METLGKFIRNLRHTKDLTLKELGQKINVSPMSISDIENDNELPTRGKVIEGLANFFEINLEYLLNLSKRTKFYKDLKAKKPKEELRVVLARKIIDSESIDRDTMKEIMAIIDKKEQF